MTKTKKTLGCNWTRYHNYYGMNSVLEAACTKQLHWDRVALHEYTLNHAPEVPEVHRAAHQKTTIPTTGEGDCPRFRQNEHELPERGHYGLARGLGGILSRSP